MAFPLDHVQNLNAGVIFTPFFLARKRDLGIDVVGLGAPTSTEGELVCAYAVLIRSVLLTADGLSGVSRNRFPLKGYTSAPDSARLVHMFHAWQAGSRSNVWFEYVPTDANPADEPSRDASLAQDRYVVGDIVSEAVDLRFPPLGSLDHLRGWCVGAAAVRARV